MALTIAVLALALLAALWTAMTRSLMRSVIGLAATSVCVTALLFMLGASLAAVFELSVCAGLITVVFVSTVAMTQPASGAELRERTRTHLRRYWPLPLLLLAAGALVAALGPGLPVSLPPPAEGADVKEILWTKRPSDILGQVAVILAGTSGVIVLFKERGK
jgi:NADH-quinone oxidoreductase subunit J